MIVNEYVPGQGINPHVDRPDVFGDCIVTISLGSDTVMTFERAAADEQAKSNVNDPKRVKTAADKHSVDVVLKRRSVAVLTGPARYEWTHAIPARKSDGGRGAGKRLRGTRVSLTFRRVVQKYKL